MGVEFSLPFPFPKIGLEFSTWIPVPEKWEWNLPFPVPVPEVQKSFPLMAGFGWKSLCGVIVWAPLCGANNSKRYSTFQRIQQNWFLFEIYVNRDCNIFHFHLKKWFSIRDFFLLHNLTSGGLLNLAVQWQMTKVHWKKNQIAFYCTCQLKLWFGAINYQNSKWFGVWAYL